MMQMADNEFPFVSIERGQACSCVFSDLDGLFAHDLLGRYRTLERGLPQLAVDIVASKFPYSSASSTEAA
jgi:hypothetical protein